MSDDKKPPPPTEEHRRRARDYWRTITGDHVNCDTLAQLIADVERAAERRGAERERERAIKVCEAFRELAKRHDPSEFGEHAVNCANTIRASIRALADEKEDGR